MTSKSNSFFFLCTKNFQRFLIGASNDEQGQDLVEYALLTGFMVVAVWALFPAEIVPSISGIFSRLISTAAVLVP